VVDEGWTDEKSELGTCFERERPEEGGVGGGVAINIESRERRRS
jgi:hypothetical protein